MNKFIQKSHFHLTNFNRLCYILGMDIDEYFKDKDGNPLDALDGLAKLMGDLGIDCEIERENNQLTLSLEVNGKLYEGIKLRVAEEACKKQGVEGMIWLVSVNGKHSSGQIGISLNRHNTVAELATTFLHEVCHSVLWVEIPWMSKKNHHYYIYKGTREIMEKVEKRAEGHSKPYSFIYTLKYKYLAYYWYYVLRKEPS